MLNDVNLQKTRARTVAPHIATQLVDEWIMNQHRIEDIRGIKHPIGIRREAQDREALVPVEFIQELQREARLRHPRRARTAHMEATAGQQGWTPVERSLSIHRFIEGEVRRTQESRPVDADGIHY